VFPFCFPSCGFKCNLCFCRAHCFQINFWISSLLNMGPKLIDDIPHLFWVILVFDSAIPLGPWRGELCQEGRCVFGFCRSSGGHEGVGPVNMC
jgi:hypothetical protein